MSPPLGTTSAKLSRRPISTCCRSRSRKVMRYRQFNISSTGKVRGFATSREPTYYEVLNVPVTASQAEIKKQFYTLSLTHHPDRNRSDPTASSQFATISDAYHTLSDASKRARYNRDHGIVAISEGSTPNNVNPEQHPMGSHSSYSANLHNKGSYVGSRPASGLSKRRGIFKGPPPSFYAHGGYGAQSSRQNAASASGPSLGRQATTASERDPSSFIHNNSVWHFNAQSHFRTQSAEDTRRAKRKFRGKGLKDRTVGADGGSDTTGSMGFRFIVVCGILFGATTLSSLFQSSSSSSLPQSSSKIDGERSSFSR